MKIGRIKEIKNIGTFADFKNGGRLGFEKLTFIYGFNTYGKTTLSDIFHSLKLNDSEIIRSRKTIPQQNASQKIVLTRRGQTENEIKFENNDWEQNNLHSCLDVFSNAFIHKNLFTGLTIERENRENFTKFVLGKRGVKTAEEVAEKKKLLGEKKRGLQDKLPPFVKSRSDEEIEKFLKFSIEGLDRNHIEEKLAQRQVELLKEKTLINEPQRILNLPNPLEYKSSEIDYSSLIKGINELFQEDYSNIKDEVLDKLNQHILSNFSNGDDPENWLRKGMLHSKDSEHGNCPFCGQALKNASELINVYHSYFDPAYTEFINRIETGLSKNIRAVEDISFSQKTDLQDALTKANNYKELIADENFQKRLSELENIIKQLNEDRLNNEKKQLVVKMRTQADLKNKSPHKSVERIDCSDFNTAAESYRELLADVKDVISQIRIHIEDFKRPYRDTKTIQGKIDQITQEIEDLRYKKARIEQDKDCREYLNFQEKIDELQESISTQEEKLEKDQSDYLRNYFAEINMLFGKLGGKNFKLEKVTQRKGHLPVYSLRVKFRDKEISNDQLETVFSDSDRRALALAVFWAKINLKPDAEKANSIIILDDPVTSFDDNRITNSINLFKNTLDQIDQMIILTHYTHFIKRFCEITKEKQITTKFLEIEQDNTTSFLTESSRDEFVASDYQKAFIKIYDFINRKHSESIKTELRPFLESFYLPTVFAKRISDKQVDCSNLESMIDGIFDDEEETRGKMHEFRTTLNPDSHLFTSANDEDIRNFAHEMMDYLYSLEFPMST